LQRHYAILQAIALDENELRETRDETLPDEEGMNRFSTNFHILLFNIPSYKAKEKEKMLGTYRVSSISRSCRPAVVKAIEQFKQSIYGDDPDEESDSGAKEKSKKRKAGDADDGKYDYIELAKTGKVKAKF